MLLTNNFLASSYFWMKIFSSLLEQKCAEKYLIVWFRSHFKNNWRRLNNDAKRFSKLSFREEEGQTKSYVKTNLLTNSIYCSKSLISKIPIDISPFLHIFLKFSTLHFDFLAAIWLQFDCNLAVFWLHFDCILIFWLNLGCILAKDWMHFDCIMIVS